ncbi:polysaccharide deacetylase [Mitosporidium daphniae]|uniref:Polysaccharide deacetylase n=1 Tax=Mitosporidium daphniae TaxID=1485682 RepID=A0A098VTP2_9MICR|nr:polysaccharide deacetylase [Mitosporidium daphniae]KGG52458.1 polysaccharide deacetylase [Mitosporidium daphniae]|eukprot:XP_013238885.1 polysaccharide deacetylase [Mitosporidium daphniae]
MIKDILNYDVKYVRLPYGSYPKDAIKFAEQLGFVITEHSLDSKDFLGSSDAMVHSYQNALSPTSNFIAVHRDHAKVTALYLPNIILLIKKQRLRPFLLSQCI